MPLSVKTRIRRAWRSFRYNSRLLHWRKLREIKQLTLAGWDEDGHYFSGWQAGNISLCEYHACLRRQVNDGLA